MQVLKDSVRERILSTATRLFANRGFTETSMRQIAMGAGITAGNIYRYFENKDEILDIILQPLLEFINQLIEERGANQALRNQDGHIELHRFTSQGIVKIQQNFRLEYTILLKQGKGSPYADYYDHLIEKLSEKIKEFCLCSSNSGLYNTHALIYNILARNQLNSFIYVLENIKDPQEQESVINQYLNLMLKTLSTR